MEEIIQALQIDGIARALYASCMVGVMCGLLGCFIVLRNMALIGDALSHAVLPGVVGAFMFLGYNTLGFFVGSVIAGFISAIAITWIQHNSKTKNDAAIGIVFTAMFALGVIGISWLSQNEGVHLDLKDFLFGNVLGVSDEDLYLNAAITIYVIGSIILFYRYLFVTTFQPTIAQTMGISVKVIHYYIMLLLSFAVVASLKTVGVILVVAMLITPASTALLLSNRLKIVLVIAAITGLFSSIIGLFLAIKLDTTPGPAMAVVATFFYLLALLFAPQKGIIARKIIKRKVKYKIDIEDILKESLKLELSHELTFQNLLDKLSIRQRSLKRKIQNLQSQNLMLVPIGLTDKGKQKALKLVRAHRLWETYLVNKMGLTEEQIHDEAEKLEHLLPDEILDEVEQTLGFPTQDPHGSPIPPKPGRPQNHLFLLNEDESAIISNDQNSENIISELWKVGLLPNHNVKVVQKELDQIQVMINEKNLWIPAKIARQIKIVTSK